MRVSSSSSALLSSPALTVTVWAVPQLEVVKVSWLELRVSPEMVRPVPEWPPIVTVTLAVGWVASLTV